MSAPRAICPVCLRRVLVRKDDRLRVHDRDTTVQLAGRPVYNSELCAGSERIIEPCGETEPHKAHIYGVHLTCDGRGSA